MKVLSLEPSKRKYMYFIHAFLMISKLSTRTELNKEIKKKYRGPCGVMRLTGRGPCGVVRLTGRGPCGIVRLTGRGPCTAGPLCTQPWWTSC